MLLRLPCGRRVLGYLKLIGCLLVTIFYFSFLFYESINAFEEKKLRAAAATGRTPDAVAAVKQELKSVPRHNRFMQQQDKPRQSTLPTVTEPSTLNPVYEYSEEIHSATEKDLQQRLDHLTAVCQRYNLQSQYPPNPWEFFISPGHNLVWCNVFKAASSTWMYYFNILGGYDIAYLQRTEKQPIELARKRFPRPDLNELLDIMPSSMSFLFVRHPFERIVSAYRDKLEFGRNVFYRPLGHKIAHKFRQHTFGMRPRTGPTFGEFLRYLIDQQAHHKQLDEHWAPVYSFCTPCSVNFKIIGKIETFQRDSEFIIRQAGLESLLLGKLPKHKLRKIANLASGTKTDALVTRYFSEIDSEILDQLLKIYRLDFELFDFDYSKYYRIVQQTGGPATAPSATLAAERLDHNNSNNATITATTAITAYIHTN